MVNCARCARESLRVFSGQLLSKPVCRVEAVWAYSMEIPWIFADSVEFVCRIREPRRVIGCKINKEREESWAVKSNSEVRHGEERRKSAASN